jgi:hypothetical protein
MVSLQKRRSPENRHRGWQAAGNQRNDAVEIQNPDKICNALRAELVGSSHCTAAGVTASGYMPVLMLCRELLKAGHDPAAEMHVYRGPTLCLTVRTIGQATALEIRGDGVGFRYRPKLGTAPPIASLTEGPQ